MSSESDKPADPKSKPVDPESATKRDAIEENLKRVYDETLNEPLPDRFTALLDKLKSEKGK